MSKNFCLKFINQQYIKDELNNIGFDKSYIETISDKFRYINVKIFDLTLPQANILKQTALSVGADCAVNKGVLTSEVEITDCILGGSISQIKKIIDKLQNQQFSMKILSENLADFITEKKIRMPKIVGILNLTTNSFSDGGLYYNFEDAVEHLHKLIDQGADIIDIGAESTKPYSKPVSSELQIEKIKPILEYILKNNIKVPISIDTRSALVAKRAIDMGATYINDVSGFDYDADMLKTVANNNVKVIIQHSKGCPETMQNNPIYNNLIDDIYLSLREKINKAKEFGLKKENIIVDVGIGFGKTQSHCFDLIKRIDEFKSLGCETMLGISRKSFLGIPELPNDEKDIYTLAINSLVIEKQVNYLRVHNVKLHRKLIDIMKNFYKEN